MKFRVAILISVGVCLITSIATVVRFSIGRITGFEEKKQLTTTAQLQETAEYLEQRKTIAPSPLLAEYKKDLNDELTRDLYARGVGVRSKRHSAATMMEPVLDDPGGTLILPSAKATASVDQSSFPHNVPIFVEMDFYRLRGTFGLMDSGWSDVKVLGFLQRVVDIWWVRAGIMIRIREEDALRPVKMPRINSLAYAAYVEYGKLDPNDNRNVLMEERAAWHDGEYAKKVEERRLRLESELGPDLVSMLLQTKDVGQLELMRFIRCWPLCFKPWTVLHTIPVFPFFYYHFMNGMGNPYNAIEVRSGSCAESPKRKLWGEPVRCYRFALRGKELHSGALYSPNGTVRGWEVLPKSEGGGSIPMTTLKAARLTAHESGHTFGLGHPKTGGRGCKSYEGGFDNGELMAQVRAVGSIGIPCKQTMGMSLASGVPNATVLSYDEVTKARSWAAKKRDLQQSPTVLGGATIGDSVCQPRDACPALTTVARVALFIRLPAPTAGRVRRVRWAYKSFTEKPRDDLVLFVARRFAKIEEGSDSDCGHFEVVISTPVVRSSRLAALQPAVHTEVDVDLPIEAGEYLGIAVVRKSNAVGGDGDQISSRPLGLAQRLLHNADVLTGDLLWSGHASTRNLRDGGSKRKMSTEEATALTAVVKLNSKRTTSICPSININFGRMHFQHPGHGAYLKTFDSWHRNPRYRALHAYAPRPVEARRRYLDAAVCLSEEELKTAAQGTIVYGMQAPEERSGDAIRCSAPLFNYDMVEKM